VLNSACDNRMEPPYDVWVIITQFCDVYGLRTLLRVSQASRVAANDAWKGSQYWVDRYHAVLSTRQTLSSTKTLDITPQAMRQWLRNNDDLPQYLMANLVQQRPTFSIVDPLRSLFSTGELTQGVRADVLVANEYGFINFSGTPGMSGAGVYPTYYFDRTSGIPSVVDIWTRAHLFPVDPCFTWDRTLGRVAWFCRTTGRLHMYTTHRASPSLLLLSKVYTLNLLSPRISHAQVALHIYNHRLWLLAYIPGTTSSEGVRLLSIAWSSIYKQESPSEETEASLDSGVFDEQTSSSDISDISDSSDTSDISDISDTSGTGYRTGDGDGDARQTTFTIHEYALASVVGVITALFSGNMLTILRTHSEPYSKTRPDLKPRPSSEQYLLIDTLQNSLVWRLNRSTHDASSVLSFHLYQRIGRKTDLTFAIPPVIRISDGLMAHIYGMTPYIADIHVIDVSGTQLVKSYQYRVCKTTIHDIFFCAPFIIVWESDKDGHMLRYHHDTFRVYTHHFTFSVASVHCITPTCFFVTRTHRGLGCIYQCV